VLAVPSTAVPDALRQGGDLRGKIVMSTRLNALEPDMSGLAVGTTTSAMEEISKIAPLRSARKRNSIVRRATCRRFDGSHRIDRHGFRLRARCRCEALESCTQYNDDMGERRLNGGKQGEWKRNKDY
jgi:hypothetical protein